MHTIDVGKIPRAENWDIAECAERSLARSAFKLNFVLNVLLFVYTTMSLTVEFPSISVKFTTPL